MEFTNGTCDKCHNRTLFANQRKVDCHLAQFGFKDWYIAAATFVTTFNVFFLRCRCWKSFSWDNVQFGYVNASTFDE